jgi:hypothetical protein
MDVVADNDNDASAATASTAASGDKPVTAAATATQNLLFGDDDRYVLQLVIVSLLTVRRYKLCTL